MSLPATAPCCPKDQPHTSWQNWQGPAPVDSAGPSSLIAWVSIEKENTQTNNLWHVFFFSSSMCFHILSMPVPSAYIYIFLPSPQHTPLCWSMSLFPGTSLESPCTSTTPYTALDSIYHTVRSLLMSCLTFPPPLGMKLLQRRDLVCLNGFLFFST